MKTLVFATSNQHKINEVNHLLQVNISILSLDEIGYKEEITETESTLEGNAILKASHIKNKFEMDCFADDTGLEVKALGGKPGVFSARYAGPDHNFIANYQKLLSELTGITDRSARFRTVIALFIDGSKHLFEGVLEGEITDFPTGMHGFGYDPVFKPKGYNITLAEMTLAEKNQISHRAIAIGKLANFLNTFSK